MQQNRNNSKGDQYFCKALYVAFCNKTNCNTHLKSMNKKSKNTNILHIHEGMHKQSFLMKKQM